MPAQSSTSELQTFYRAVSALRDKRDIPLFIIEDGAKENGEPFWNSLDSQFTYVALTSEHSFESLRDAVVEAQTQQRPLIIDIQVDPHPLVIGMLNTISDSGTVISGGANGKPEVVRLIAPVCVAIRRRLLEGGISYEGFTDLFGAGFSIH